MEQKLEKKRIPSNGKRGLLRCFLNNSSKFLCEDKEDDGDEDDDEDDEDDGDDDEDDNGDDEEDEDEEEYGEDEEDKEEEEEAENEAENEDSKDGESGMLTEREAIVISSKLEFISSKFRFCLKSTFVYV